MASPQVSCSCSGRVVRHIYPKLWYEDIGKPTGADDDGNATSLIPFLSRGDTDI
jgi:hypothetical protein